MKALIVEYEPLIRFMHEVQMRALGYECTCCADATTALHSCCQTFYPLIITDGELPDMNGRELCRRIRELPRGTQTTILVVSGHDTPEDIRAAIDAGADDFLGKPASPKQITERVIVLRQRSHQENRLRIQ